MKSVSRLMIKGLGGKVRVQAVPVGNGFYHGLKCHDIVRRGNGVGIAKVDFILSRPLLVVGAFGANAHLLQGETYFTADVLPPVFRRYVHISGFVIGDFGWPAPFI